MNRSFVKIGVGTGLIIIAYFALIFAFVTRDQKLQDQILELTQQRDQVRSNLKSAEEINKRLQTNQLLSSSLFSAMGSSWQGVSGVDLNALPDQDRRPTRIALEMIEELQKNVRLWPRIDGAWITGRFARVAGGSKAPITGLSHALAGSTDAAYRQTAARLLGRLKDLKCVNPLTKALEDDSPAVREAAASALGEIGGGVASGNLIWVLESDPNPTVRASAARAMASCGGWAHTDRLSKLLGIEPSVDTRMEIITAIVKIGDPQAERLIVIGLEDPSALVRARTEDALEGLGALRLPLDDSIYRIVPIADYLTLAQAGKTARVKRRDGYIYFEVNTEADTTVDGVSILRHERSWYRSKES